MGKYSALVIGASGGLGKALTQLLSADEQYQSVHAVSRHPNTGRGNKLVWHQIDSSDEGQVSELVESLRPHRPFSLIICCTGTLHASTGNQALQPEKRLEDLDPQKLLNYFKINTLIPTIWLKHAMTLLKGSHNANLVFFSARVGSISDNRLGGWYGYRASKSALNMMIKTAQVEYARRANNVCLTCYHPGTVDTPLSKPFQANVAKEKLFTPQFSAGQLLKIVPTLELANAPHYIDWQGKPIPW